MVLTDRLPLLIYPILIGLLFIITQSDFYSLSVLIGIICFSFIEYVVHRFLFHSETLSKPYKRFLGNGHIVHHKYPYRVSNLLLPLKLTLLIASLILSAVYIISGLVYLAPFFLGFAGAYLFYEVVHLFSHHCTADVPFFSYMRRYHLLHHSSKEQVNFMVSHPLFDLIFKTFKRP